MTVRMLGMKKWICLGIRLGSPKKKKKKRRVRCVYLVWSVVLVGAERLEVEMIVVLIIRTKVPEIRLGNVNVLRTVPFYDVPQTSTPPHHHLHPIPPQIQPPVRILIMQIRLGIIQTRKSPKVWE